MKLRETSTWLFAVGLACFIPFAGCDSVPQSLIDDILDDVGDIGDIVDIVAPDLVELRSFATNTDGASGIALDADGNLYAVNSTGLFGPIAEGTDLSQLSPIGAENLDEIFPIDTDSLVLAISNSGEFWIGSGCCSVLARVPAERGDAVEFAGLLEGGTTGLQPETMAIVPEGFEGPQMSPGNLLLSSETKSTSDRMSAIDVEGELAVVDVDNARVDPNNPDIADRRQGHHLTFGLDGQLYGSRGAPGLTIVGLKSIDTDGTPTDLPNTLGLAAESFVAFANGDLLLRGRRQLTGALSEAGMIWYTPSDQQVTMGLLMAVSDISEDDEMVISSDGRVFMALPNRNEIVQVIDIR